LACQRLQKTQGPLSWGYPSDAGKVIPPNREGGRRQDAYWSGRLSSVQRRLRGLWWLLPMCQPLHDRHR